MGVRWRKKQEKRRKGMHRAAAKAPAWLRTIAATEGKISGWEVERAKKRKLGSSGPASEVRQIELTPAIREAALATLRASDGRKE